jgi:hypothetical protein
MEGGGMEHWELVARESIRDLVARYNANGDSGRFDPMLELFAEDASMELDDGVHHGRAAIRAIFEGAAAGTGQTSESRAAFIRHFTATHQIDVESETEARGRCYYAVLTDEGLDHWGRYIDQYRCIDGRWLFWYRRVTMDAAVPGGWAAK